MSWRSVWLGVLLAATAAAPAVARETSPPVGAELNVQLMVVERHAENRTMQPVTSGVPLPEGAFKDVSKLRLVDDRGHGHGDRSRREAHRGARPRDPQRHGPRGPRGGALP